MTHDELVAKLNNDLSNEYSHWHFYINAAIRVQGLHREEFQEFFLKEAAGEMEHIVEFGKLICGLGGNPTKEVASFPSEANTPEELLTQALMLEEIVVSNYVDRMDDAEALEESGGQDRIDGRYVHIFLEDQILDSRKAIDHIRELVGY
jgi:bacterioferritin (cytochrome b1)